MPADASFRFICVSHCILPPKVLQQGLTLDVMIPKPQKQLCSRLLYIMKDCIAEIYACPKHISHGSTQQAFYCFVSGGGLSLQGCRAG